MPAEPRHSPSSDADPASVQGSGARFISGERPSVRSVASDKPASREVLHGRYELLALLGAGGMGNVYRVHDRQLDEIVALKMIRRELAQAQGILARFRQEVRLARKITHPNVLRIFDIGEHAGEPFLTMELVCGESLAEKIDREGPLAVDAAIDIAMAVARGLGAAHEVGVVHRDLKPENVLLGDKQRVVIADFGIARGFCSGSDSPSSTSSVFIGTPAYMAPEQVEAKPCLDGRADIFAFGAMLYEVLTGEPPWLGTTPLATATMRLHTPARDPRLLRPTLPAPFAELILRCLARNPEDRYDDATELLSALEQLPRGARVSRRSRSAAAFRSTVGALGGIDAALEIARGAVGDGVGLTPAPRVVTVAVLPFRALGDDDEHVASSITEDIIDALSVVASLRVRPRGSVATYAGYDGDPRSAGRDLGVAVVVLGSVLAENGKIRISTRVVCADNGFQLWAKRLEGPASTFGAMVESLAHAIGDAVGVELLGQARRAPTDPVALDLYLRGRHEHGRFWREGNARAIALLAKAHERAPADPVIMGGYAMALMRRYALEDAAIGAASLGQRLAEQALAEAPHLAEPRVALAMLWLNRGDVVTAMSELARALALSPTLAEAQDLVGTLLCELGRTDEGLARLSAAEAIEPRLVPARWRRARALALAGKWREADAILGQVPVDEDTRNIYWLTRARMALWRRHPDLDTLRQDLGDAASTPFFFREFVEAIFATIETMTVDPRALRLLDRWQIGATPRRAAFLCQVRADLHAFVQDPRAAIDAIEAADAGGLFDVAWLDDNPLFSELFDDADFDALRTRIHARAAGALAALALPEPSRLR